MLDLGDAKGYEFFRPLVTGWLAKIESALTCQARKRWKDVSDECLMFYSKSAAGMWDPLYVRKFWRGIKAPRFRININKAFEFIAVYAPNLLWDIPHRTVTPKKLLELPPELFPDEQVQQAVMQQLQGDSVKDKVVAHLLENVLNYLPREMPGNGMEWHNERAVLDAMLKGAGCLWSRPYSFPTSDRTLVGSFYEPPDDLIFDPDFKTSHECKWIALRHTQAHWQVERRFGLPPGSLKNRATLESSWHYSELVSQADQGMGDRKGGKTNDLVVWYEIWSKLGCGARMTGMASELKGPLEELIGDYAYLAICPDCPYPLNCSSEKVRSGATPEEIRRHFEWPVPLWTDDRWPVERLIFYEDPESPYGLPPLAPALGELKAINAIVSWLVNRTWQTSRQMYAVLGSYHDDMKKILDDGEDLCVVPIPAGQDDIRKIIQVLETKEVNKDAWSVLELLSNAFDKRMGMTPFVYGQNEDGTQDRTAETTAARKAAVSARPEYMAKKVVSWQSRVASAEATLLWLFVKGNDVAPRLGQVGAGLWGQYIENADAELVMRQMSYEVAAASIRRPNRERDIANLQEVLARWLPVMQDYGSVSGDYTPVNGTMKKWADLHDMTLDEMYFPAKDPNDPNAQLDQQLKQAEVQKTQAEAMKLQGEAQANPAMELAMESQFKQQELQMEQAAEEQRLQMELIKLQAELEAKKAELELKMQEGAMKLQQKQAEGQVDLEVKKEQGAQQIAMGNQQLRQSEQQHQQTMKQQAQQGAVKVATSAAQTKAKVDSTKQTTQAKVQATKQMAAAKPKPTVKK